ncbi:hypothetical protein [Ilyobacter polytropus]|uniref:Uncharacterized protein n=1 Tax=Ilyobacter polytropus (strain ATCC 51220 / DSM 2926 / LMG 16218 / CuHBu1) TaxID=572544 RepID=E3H6Y6_ILYPC|nr:hypothetical protein [Ilyobacter polytropus]ADO82505.1 hypothetical protein Ilyop_0718 [Ilyobacter polytropus DSM 2926]
MKRIMVFLMFLILLSGMAYSRSIYLVVPKDAYSSMSYYAVDKSGTVTIIEDKDLLNKKYMGNDKLYLVTLKAGSEGTFKMMAKYKLDGKYYFLVLPDADVDTIKSEFNSTDTLSEVYDNFASYSSYPGIKIKDDVRLSLLPINTGDKNITEITEEVTLNGYTGINPNSSDDKEFYMKLESGTEYGLKKNSDVSTDKDKDKDKDNTYNLYSIVTDKDGNKSYSKAGTTEFEKITTIRFTSKDIKDTTDNVLTEDGVSIKNNETYTYEGDMKASFEKENGNGQWSMVIDGTAGGGDTIVFIEDTGVSAESGIAVKSKVNNKSRARDTNIKTSLIDSYNFVIENIKE